MSKTVLDLNSARVKEIAVERLRRKGEDPFGYGDYSDLRNGVQKWEYHEEEAATAHRKEVLDLLIAEIAAKGHTSVGDIVTATVDVLDGHGS